jgi:hypothetical protein
MRPSQVTSWYSITSKSDVSIINVMIPWDYVGIDMFHGLEMTFVLISIFSCEFCHVELMQ